MYKRFAVPCNKQLSPTPSVSDLRIPGNQFCTRIDRFPPGMQEYNGHNGCVSMSANMPICSAGKSVSQLNYFSAITDTRHLLICVSF